MLLLTDQWNFVEWFNWLDQDLRLKLGQDYHWSWYSGTWAIDIKDPAVELIVLLKTPAALIEFVPTHREHSNE